MSTTAQKGCTLVIIIFSAAADVQHMLYVSWCAAPCLLRFELSELQHAVQTVLDRQELCSAPLQLLRLLTFRHINRHAANGRLEPVCVLIVSDCVQVR